MPSSVASTRPPRRRRSATTRPPQTARLKHVAAQRVGAEPVLGRGRLHARERVDVLRVVGGDPGRGRSAAAATAASAAGRGSASVLAQPAPARRRRRARSSASVLAQWGVSLSLMGTVDMARPSVAGCADRTGGSSRSISRLISTYTPADSSSTLWITGIVVALHRVDHQPAHAGNREHRLGDHHAADQQRDAHAHRGGDRDGRIAQRVAQHRQHAQALGARCGCSPRAAPRARWRASCASPARCRPAPRFMHGSTSPSSQSAAGSRRSARSPAPETTAAGSRRRRSAGSPRGTPAPRRRSTANSITSRSIQLPAR